MDKQEFKPGQEILVRAIYRGVDPENKNIAKISVKDGSGRNWVYVDIDQFDEPQKPTIPKVALEYYEAYVDKLTGFDEWFGDFFDKSFLEEFPKAGELSEWLYDNDTKTNMERELALATLIVKGSTAVKIEQEKLYTVEIPNNGGTLVLASINDRLKLCHGYKHNPTKLTEAEIRKDFEWAWRERFAKEVER